MLELRAWRKNHSGLDRKFSTKLGYFMIGSTENIKREKNRPQKDNS